jgi:hypothetical protein
MLSVAVFDVVAGLFDIPHIIVVSWGWDVLNFSYESFVFGFEVGCGCIYLFRFREFAFFVVVLG